MVLLEPNGFCLVLKHNLQNLLNLFLNLYMHAIGNQMLFYNNEPIVLHFLHKTQHNQFLKVEESLVLLQIFFLIRTLQILLLFANSKVSFLPILLSAAPGCGPCGIPAGCKAIFPALISFLLMKSPKT